MNQNPAESAHRVPTELYQLRFGAFAIAFAATWGGIALAWGLASVFKFWWVWLLATLFIGVQQNALSNLLHDAFHWRVHRSKNINDFLARWFLSAPLLLPLEIGRASHLTHHRLLGRVNDPDRMYYGNTGKATRLKFVLFLLVLFSGVQFLRVGFKVLFSRLRTPGGGAGQIWDGPDGPVAANRGSLVPDLAAVVVVQVLIALLLWRLTGQWWAGGILWLLPMVTVLVGLNSLRTFCEHVELTPDDNTEPSRLYTHPSYFPESYIFAPFNMNFHADHHLQVAVPFYNLPKLRKYYRDAGERLPYSERPTYLGTLRRYWKALPLKSAPVTGDDGA